MSAEPQKVWTADEFFYSPLSENHELVEGKIVPTELLGTFDGLLLSNLNLLLSEFIHRNDLGITVVNVGFILARNPDTVRGARLAFISKSKLAETGITEKFYPSAPDFVIEIASENIKFEEVKKQNDEFLQAGTDAAWIINRQKIKTGYKIAVNIFQRNGMTLTAEKNFETDGKNLIKGFNLLALELLKGYSGSENLFENS